MIRFTPQERLLIRTLLVNPLIHSLRRHPPNDEEEFMQRLNHSFHRQAVQIRRGLIIGTRSRIFHKTIYAIFSKPSAYPFDTRCELADVIIIHKVEDASSMVQEKRIMLFQTKYIHPNYTWFTLDTRQLRQLGFYLIWPKFHLAESRMGKRKRNYDLGGSPISLGSYGIQFYNGNSLALSADHLFQMFSERYRIATSKFNDLPNLSCLCSVLMRTMLGNWGASVSFSNELKNLIEDIYMILELDEDPPEDFVPLEEKLPEKKRGVVFMEISVKKEMPGE